MLVSSGYPLYVQFFAAKDYVEEKGIGRRKVNYRLRDAIFSRQRYWGEPFPIYYKDGIATPVDESDLPIRLMIGMMGRPNFLANA